MSPHLLGKCGTANCHVGTHGLYTQHIVHKRCGAYTPQSAKFYSMRHGAASAHVAQILQTYKSLALAAGKQGT